MYNQLRANVRNYCVGLTAPELWTALALSLEWRDMLRAEYVAEFLCEEWEG